MAAGADLKKEIANQEMLLFLIPNQKYSERLRDVAGASAKLFERTCYVSLNKPYDTLASSFKNDNMDMRKITFIDCVTQGGKNAPAGQKVVFVSSPSALTDMSIAINKVIDEDKAQSVIFDSLSTLLVYQEPSMVIKFSHSLISKLRAAKVKGILTCLQDDVKGELVKDLGMFVDKVVELG